MLRFNSLAFFQSPAVPGSCHFLFSFKKQYDELSQGSLASLWQKAAMPTKLEFYNNELPTHSAICSFTHPHACSYAENLYCQK